MPAHEAHYLTYAKNADGKLVHVDEVENGDNCGCLCPACNEPLVAKNKGKIKMHHFAHKSGTECNFAYESMLHLLAKEKIRKAFMESRTFNLQFEYRSYCRNEKTCPFIHYTECYMSSQRAFNLVIFKK